MTRNTKKRFYQREGFRIRLILFLVMVVVSLIIVTPYVWMLSNSFKSTKEWKEEIIYIDSHKMLPWQKIVMRDGAVLTPKPDSDWREEYVNWLTSPKNRRFAEVLVNRMWYWMFGKGIVNEPDDWREDNKPSDPALLKELTDYFLKNNFSVEVSHFA